MCWWICLQKPMDFSQLNTKSLCKLWQRSCNGELLLPFLLYVWWLQHGIAARPYNVLHSKLRVFDFEWIKVTSITNEGNFYIRIYEYQQQYKNCKDISLEFFNANLKKWKKVRSKITELIISNAYLLFTSIVIVNILKCKSSLLGCICCWDSQVCWFKEETLGL